VTGPGECGHTASGRPAPRHGRAAWQAPGRARCGAQERQARQRPGAGGWRSAGSWAGAWRGPGGARARASREAVRPSWQWRKRGRAARLGLSVRASGPRTAWRCARTRSEAGPGWCGRSAREQASPGGARAGGAAVGAEAGARALCRRRAGG
jgi:hypothetical protein